ncbi:hypothetical protein D3C80_1998060 [compost metagenome]
MIVAVNAAVSSCIPTEILYIWRPSGTRIRAATGITVNMISVIRQFRYSRTATEPTMEITPLKKAVACSEISVFRINVSFVIRLLVSPVRF